MASVEQVIKDLRGFQDRKIVIKELRAGLRKPLPAVTARFRAWSVATLPTRGGLGRWAAQSKLTESVKVGSSSVQIKVKASRKSLKKESDLKALDRGRVRHPSWGRRGPTQWHVQLVQPGFFSRPVSEAPEWDQAVSESLDNAFDHLRRG